MIYADLKFLNAFEERLDPAAPERPGTGAAIIGYGEISTVLRIDGHDDVVVKRMAGFEKDEEVSIYCDAVQDYCKLLDARGIQTIPTTCHPIRTERNGRVVYLVQPALPPGTIGNAILRNADERHLQALLRAVLDRLAALWQANRQGAGQVQLGLDGQISNWAWSAGEDTGNCRLLYLDVGTPLFRRMGREAMDPAIMLRATPSFLAWALTRFLLPGVVDRYYSLREVVKDLVANFIKEGREDWIALALREVNSWMEAATAEQPVMMPLTETEVRSYYASDARLWTAFQACRRLDRFVRTRLRREGYNYILPGRIRR